MLCNFAAMFIKNQTFKDEETLEEMIFDFALGEPSALVQELLAGIDKGLEDNIEYIKYRDSLQDEDDKEELYTDERQIRLAEKLMKRFDSFMVEAQKLYGIQANERSLLYEIDLV